MKKQAGFQLLLWKCLWKSLQAALMRALQNNGKYPGNSHGNTVFEKTKNGKQFGNIPASPPLSFSSITHRAKLSSLKLLG